MNAGENNVYVDMTKQNWIFDWNDMIIVIFKKEGSQWVMTTLLTVIYIYIYIYIYICLQNVGIKHTFAFPQSHVSPKIVCQIRL